MASAIKPFPFSFFFFSLFIILSSFNAISAESKSPDPKPTPWPPQFHALLFMNLSSGNLQATDLWYDWPKGRNFNIIHKQLGKLLYDLEWDNGTSFYYTLDSTRECEVMKFSVGILRPNWLENATYLGQRKVDGFLCNVWEKVDFIWYYEDVVTKRPVQWIFYTGLTTHVMTFEVGAVLEDEQWQAPVYCFSEGKNEDPIESVVDVDSSWGLRMMNSV